MTPGVPPAASPAAPPSVPAPSPRRGLLRAVKVVAVVVVLGACAWYVAGHWDEARRALAGTTPRWPLLGGSAAAVLLAYGVLIQVWRAILGGAGEHLPFWPAARIWTVSNLGKYVPGKVWQMSAMALMARDRGVSGVAAAGAAILSQVVTLASGMAVTVLAGTGVLPQGSATLVAALVMVAGLAVLPFALPLAERMVKRLTRRELVFPRLDGRTLAIAVVGSTLGWILLGLGFHLLGRGLGVVTIPVMASIAAFVGSYLIGFVTLFAPGGAGTREAAMQAMLRGMGVGEGEALVLVVASRLWLTVLEILPALLFLAAGALERRHTPRPADRA